jgi:hypothetical protein
VGSRPKPLGGVETGWRAASYQSFRWEFVNAFGAAVGAVGTIGAVVVARGIAVRVGGAIRAERNDQLAAQARSVVSGVPTPEVATISNHSNEPILAAGKTALTEVLQRRRPALSIRFAGVSRR